jgi:hypothetical protein
MIMHYISVLKKRKLIYSVIKKDCLRWQYWFLLLNGITGVTSGCWRLHTDSWQFKLFVCSVDFYTYITYNFVAVDFMSNICQKTCPVAVLQIAE